MQTSPVGAAGVVRVLEAAAGAVHEEYAVGVDTPPAQLTHPTA